MQAKLRHTQVRIYIRLSIYIYPGLVARIDGGRAGRGATIGLERLSFLARKACGGSRISLDEEGAG